VNPYNTLKERCRLWAMSVLHPRQVVSFTLKDARTAESFRLHGVWDRVRTADQCGYEAIIVVSGDDLVMELRKRPDTIPWEIKP